MLGGEQAAAPEAHGARAEAMLPQFVRGPQIRPRSTGRAGRLFPAACIGSIVLVPAVGNMECGRDNLRRFKCIYYVHYVQRDSNKVSQVIRSTVPNC